MIQFFKEINVERYLLVITRNRMNIGLYWTFVSAMTRIIMILIESHFTVSLVEMDIAYNIFVSKDIY